MTKVETFLAHYGKQRCFFWKETIDETQNAASIGKPKDVGGVTRQIGAGNATTVTGKVDDVPGRPTWKQSENEVGDLYPGYEAQKSFRNGEEVSHGAAGSSRPDFYSNGHSVEVKNYNIETSNGINNLANNVSKQVNERVGNLPPGTSQTVAIDVRGQTYTSETLEEVLGKITDKCTIDVDLIFLK